MFINVTSRVQYCICLYQLLDIEFQVTLKKKSNRFIFICKYFYIHLYENLL